MQASQGWLVIDDVIIDKSGKKIEMVGKLYDHAQGKYLDYAHCLVQLWYADSRGIGYPLKSELYIKKELLKNASEFKTKHAIAQELISWAKRKGISFQGVLFDGWYLNSEFTEFIENQSKAWVSRARSNNLIKVEGKYIQIKDFVKNLKSEDFKEFSAKKRKYKYFAKSFKMKCLKNPKVQVVLISEYDEKKDKWSDIVALVSNQITWHAEKIIKSYLLRWSIETFFRDSKQHLGLGDYQMRKLAGIKRHWCLVSLAYVFLIKMKLESSLIKSLSHQLKTVGQLCSYHKDCVMEMIIHWSYAQFKNGINPNDLIKTLKLGSPLLADVATA